MGVFKCGALKDHWLRIIADLKLIGWRGDTRRSHWVKLEEGSPMISYNVLMTKIGGQLWHLKCDILGPG
ncbi:hypothetical protein AMECASPLE_014560 [Ameca splendens]|uniref:Uncharacterized protein n=1 Tax=Ameca splendens TaxID=208324 RepID=A0ABV1A7Z0_9TELE